MRRGWLGAAGMAAAVLTAAGAAEPPSAATVRDIALAPARFANRGVRLTGRFAGRIRPDAASPLRQLKKSRWDFVLESDGAALWVSGLRPAGREFDLDPARPARTNAEPWLQVTGTVRVARSGAGGCTATDPCHRVWIEATDLHLAPPPSDLQSGPPARVRSTTPVVVFHDPIADETDVPHPTAVRVQFSRPMIAETFEGRVRASYASPRRLAAAALPRFTAVYRDWVRALEIRFAEPLDGAQTVRIELLEGIAGADGAPLAPWSLTFTTAPR